MSRSSVSKVFGGGPASAFATVALLMLTLALASCVGHDDDSRTSFDNSTRTVAENAVNINTANADELETIPHVGRKLAERIIAHRERNGAFRRPEQLLLVQGISDKRFREIRHLIRVE